MRFPVAPSLALALGICLSTIPGSAPAAPLGFTGTLEFRFYNTPPIAFSDTGVATINGSGPVGHLTSLGLAASQIATTGATVSYTDPFLFPIVGLQLTAHNGAGSFGGVGGAGFGGPMPLAGTLKVCLYGTCGASTNYANMNVPLSVVGVAGAAVTQVGGLFKLTVIGAPWTTGTAAIGTYYTQMGGVSPLSNTGAPSGAVTLVTPIFVSTDLGSPIIPLIASLTMHFVPEPATLVLVGSGVVGLVAIGARRRGRER